MSRRSGATKGLKLNTIPVSPLALAKGYASSFAARVRETVELAQLVASTIKSVDVVSDQVHVNLAPENLDGRSMVRLPVGQQTVGLRGDVNVERSGQEYLLTLKLDAFVLDRIAGQKNGALVSQAAFRFNTQVKVVMRDTIEVEVVRDPKPPRKRLIEG